jgi:cullin 1
MAFSTFYSLGLKQGGYVGKYKPKYDGRKLTCLPSRSYAEIRYCPPESNHAYTFTVSAYQMAVLLLFEDKDSLTLPEIGEETGLSYGILDQVRVQRTVKNDIFVSYP